MYGVRTIEFDRFLTQGRKSNQWTQQFRPLARGLLAWRSNGECAVHYGRRLKGRPGNGEEQRLGKPDGAGIFGVLDENDEGVLCHECGKRFRSLGKHAVMAHDLTAAEYKDKHGIPRKQSLASRAFRENVSARSSKPEALARFARARWASPPVATQDFRDALSRSQRARYAGY